MSGSGLLALLDDIATLLDDIATMTKVAATKTAGVVGDDLAVGAEQISSISAAQELPIVKKVAIGSLLNKAILIPALLGIGAVGAATGLPLIAGLMLIGGGYLCYEGYEKVMHWRKHAQGKNDKDDKEHKEMLDAAAKNNLEDFEKKKIKGAIRTDFVLSAEILVLTLGTVAAAPLLTQVGVLAATGIGMTVLVYGLVAGIVKIDNLGAWLRKREGSSLAAKSLRNIGHGLLKTAPLLMKGLTFAGTAAMFVVGGGILMHGIPFLAALGHHLSGLAAIGVEAAAGLLAGAAAVYASKPVMRTFNACKSAIKKLFARSAPAKKAVPVIRETDHARENKLAEKNALNESFPSRARAIMKKEEAPKMPLVKDFPPVPF